MRASHRPGAASSASVGHHRFVRPDAVELVERAVAAFHHAPAERDAGLVVAAIELQPEEAIDETGRVAALEPVPAQRFVEAAVRGDHALADRFDDDVGVTLEHRHEPLQLGEQRLLPVAAHRAEQHVGIGEAGDRLHRRRDRTGRSHRAGSPSRRPAPRTRRRTPTRSAGVARAPTAPRAARRAPPRATRARSAARRAAATIPRAKASTLCATNSRVGAPSSGSGRSNWPSARCESSPIIEPGPAAEQQRHHHGEQHVGRERRRTVRRTGVGVRSRRRCGRARAASAPSTGSSPVRVRLDQVARSTLRAGTRQRGRDAGRLGDHQLHGPDDVVEGAGRFGIDRRLGLLLTRVSMSTFAIDSAVSARDFHVHGSGRLQHPHDLGEIEVERVERVRKALPHLGNVAHYASLWTMADEIVVAVTGVSGFLGQRLLPLLDASPHVDRIVGLDIRDPARRARKLEFHRVDVLGTDLRRTCATCRRSCTSRPSIGPLPDDALFTRVNVDGTRHVLDAATATGVRKIVRPSSTAVYGAWANNPVPITEDAPLRPSPGVPARDRRRRMRTPARAMGERRRRAGIATRLRIAPIVGGGRALVAHRGRDRPRAGSRARRDTAGAGRPRRRRRGRARADHRGRSRRRVQRRGRRLARVRRGGRAASGRAAARAAARARDPRARGELGDRRSATRRPRSCRTSCIPFVVANDRLKQRGLEAAALERGGAAPRDRRARSQPRAAGSRARAR